MSTASPRPWQILLVEDNPAEARLAEEAFRQTGDAFRTSWARNGEEALAFLKREGHFEEAPRPDLVLLDLNLPRVDGWEVLRAMRADPGLKELPVVILTLSRKEEDVRLASSLRAERYLVKPLTYDEFTRLVREAASLCQDGAGRAGRSRDPGGSARKTS